MAHSISPQKSPYKIKVEKGKTYFWCSCGLSQKQPFCDGSHKIEGKFKSVKYLAEESKEIYFCKYSKLTTAFTLCSPKRYSSTT